MSFLRRRKPAAPPGRYTYRGTGEFAKLALQLRVEPDGRGVVVINANTVLHLNETASAYAYHFMLGKADADVLKAIRSVYRVSEAQAKQDYEKLVYTITTLAKTEKVCPVTFLEVEKEEPFSYAYSAPLRMDLALTFRCQNDCIHCYAGGPHETPELNTQEWKQAIDRLGEAGIFILTFTGGEPTLREDLPELLLYAQNKGMVTGLITNGRRLKDKAYVQTLEKAGLDFVQITLESNKPEIHDLMTASPGSWNDTVAAVRNAVDSQIYVTTNTTLSKHNAPKFLDTVDFIKAIGVQAFGCNSLIHSGKADAVSQEFALTIEELNALLPQIRDKAHALGLKFLWYTPTQYCRLNPVQAGLGVKSCTAALINMCVGPDGDVYPCQSYFESLGNILTDKWTSIWNHPLAKSLRSRAYVEAKCKECPELQVCGGGCPLELKSGKYVCSESP
ncbi:MAG: radical SAM protein [Candidatus Bathyarchaeia archaeon]